MKNIDVKIHSNNWEQSASPAGYVRGTVFVDGIHLHGAAIMEQLPIATDSIDKWKKALVCLNGFFSFVHIRENEIIAAVDRVRSIPIFYGTTNNKVYLSDDAEWVRLQVGDSEMDPVARDEFQLTNYVTGKDTLFPNVKQLQAGELLRITCTDKEPNVQTYRYYSFTHTEPEEWEEPTLREELGRVTEAAFQRLIQYADGRQIVVPLSGGYDSRLIVAMLKRLGYDNIISFTYGAPGNKESEYSRKVAHALGVKWHFVEYSKEKWRKAWDTDERINFQLWSSGWASLPHVQDWLAVKEMKAENAVKADCIFVPGHTGDFIAGGHLPDITFAPRAFNDADLAKSILELHYQRTPLQYIEHKDRSFWKSRLLLRTETKHVGSNHEFANGFEKWDWQERQAKFICNSVRVYDFFGYEWWMPLWDAEFMAFWEDVPLDLRRGRVWYLGYVQEIYKDQTSHSPLGNASETGWLKKAAKRIVAKMGSSIYQRIWLLHNQKYVMKHIVNPYARFPAVIVCHLTKKGFNVNGIEAYMYLKDMNHFLCTLSDQTS